MFPSKGIGGGGGGGGRADAPPRFFVEVFKLAGSIGKGIDRSKLKSFDAVFSVLLAFNITVDLFEITVFMFRLASRGGGGGIASSKLSSLCSGRITVWSFGVVPASGTDMVLYGGNGGGTLSCAVIENEALVLFLIVWLPTDFSVDVEFAENSINNDGISANCFCTT